jgi:DNA-binding winged helix-turn-helix (wHTH) protein
MKRTEKDLHISLFRHNFAAKCKKTAHNVATFRKKGYLCTVS